MSERLLERKLRSLADFDLASYSGEQQNRMVSFVAAPVASDWPASLSGNE
jgi:hypothetical protein